MKLKLLTSTILLIGLISLVSAQNILPPLLKIKVQPSSVSEQILLVNSQEIKTLNLELSQELRSLISLEKTEIQVNQEQIPISFRTLPTAIPGIYTGSLIVNQKNIPIILDIQNQRKQLDLKINLPIKNHISETDLTAKLEVVNFGEFMPLSFSIKSQIRDLNNNIIKESKDIRIIEKNIEVPITLEIPSLNPGTYFLYIEASTDTQTDRTSEIFNVVQGQKTEPRSYTSNTIFLVIPLILLVGLFLIFRKRLPIKKIHIILLLILILLITFILIQLPQKEDLQQFQRSHESSLKQNITNMLSLSKLTNEPFLKNASTNLLVYFIETSERVKPPIKIETTDNNIIITVGDARLVISKSRKSYNFNIVSRSLRSAECNFLCLLKYNFLTEIIIILLLILTIFFINTKKPKEVEIPIITVEQLIQKSKKQKDLFKAARSFFITFLSLEYEPTLEELIKEIQKTRLTSKTKIILFLDHLNNAHYDPSALHKSQLKKKFNKILEEIEKSYKSKNIIIEEEYK